MAAIHETAYPRIKPNLSHKELKDIFTPQEAEISLLNSKTKISLIAPRTQARNVKQPHCSVEETTAERADKLSAQIQAW